MEEITDESVQPESFQSHADRILGGELAMGYEFDVSHESLSLLSPDLRLPDPAYSLDCRPAIRPSLPAL